MRFEVIDENDDSSNGITSFELDSNPFKVGEEINLELKNRSKDIYSAEEFDGDYIITKIQHYNIQSYTPKGHKVIHTVGLTVKRVK